MKTILNTKRNIQLSVESKVILKEKRKDHENPPTPAK
jgi:hypothetical protein